MNLQSLLVRRAGLLVELKQLEFAISSYGDATPVEVYTRKNLRNTPGVTIDPEVGENFLVVFADSGFSQVAETSGHGGYVPRSEWESFKLSGSYQPDLIWEI